MKSPQIEVGSTRDNQPIDLVPISYLANHLDLLVSWLNDPEVMQHLNPAWKPTNQTQEARALQDFESDPSCVYWTITIAGQPIGTAWLNEINQGQKSCSFGILIGEKTFWGKGVGTAVGKTVCEYAFHNLNLQCIHAALTEENTGSLRILQKLGFHLTHGSAHFTGGHEYPGWDGILEKSEY